MSTSYEVGELPAIKIGRVAEHQSESGLKIVALRHTSVPRFHIRLKMPGGKAWDSHNGNRARIASSALMTGTKNRSDAELAQELQGLGASLSAGIGLDHLSLSGSGLSANLKDYLAILAEVLTSPAFSRDEVKVVKEQTKQGLSIRRSDPSVIAHDRLVRAIYGSHPYGRTTPSPESVERVRSRDAHEYFKAHARPDHAVLVIVGDFKPAQAIRLIEDAMGGWRGRSRGRRPARAPVSDRGTTLLVDRPGAVQTNIRIAGPAVPRSSPDYFDLVLANTIFGGYFSSRLVERVREERGYSYSPRSSIEHHRRASVLKVSADVATEVTAAALVEIRYELGRIATAPVSQSELDAARTYIAGTTALSIQTQAGIAGYLSTLYSAGLDASYLRSLNKRLAEVTIESVSEAAGKYLAPPGLTTVMVGDSQQTADAVRAIEPRLKS
ncbi:MAG: insulinase family protein [Acidobacteria bacterium]|nr:MAG: insulinase family protein [Acidobacteriota bacterium]